MPLLGALHANDERTSASSAPAYVFARQEFERRATRPFRHRQMFARALSSGVVLHLMQNSLKAYNSPGGFGEGANSLHAAAVLYGTSIAALLTDATWYDLRLAEFLQHLGDLPAGSVAVNPYRNVVADLARSNASFFVCNNALHDVARALSSSSTTGGANADAASI